MNDYEVLSFLKIVDKGYTPTEKEKHDLSKIKILRWNKINYVPQSIALLTGIQVLFLGRSLIKELPAEIFKLQNLENLDLSHTQINKLPLELFQLTKLESLDLSYTWISKLPSEIKYLRNLRILDLRSTKISELPIEISCLQKLDCLFLNDTQISELPAEIKSLCNLKILSLSSTRISELPANQFWYLGNLESLYLNYIQISELPPEICQLTNLKTLDLSSTRISELPPEIGQLINLKTLDLSSTRISELPSEIGQLTNLKTLDLSSTRISELPPEIGQLTNLKTLDLSSTMISVLPYELMGLSSIQVLGLMHLTLTSLPEYLLFLGLQFVFADSGLSFLRRPGIYIHGLKLLQQPVSLFLQPRELIEDYYRQPHTEINESKVIFLGSGGVGKTYTLKRILNHNHKITEITKTTTGISITSMKFVKDAFLYRINFWDFGGQEIMYAMHRCFLTDRTGYVVVVSTRFGDVNKQARYWLRSIESFTKNSPVVIYVNIWSDGTHYSIDEYSLRRDYPNIMDIKQCSAKDGSDEDFYGVVSAIQKMALSNDSISMSFPENWEKVRQYIIRLGREGTGQFYISLDDYRQKCRENGIVNEDIQTWLLEWFNDLGECFGYNYEEKQPDPNQDYVVLNPKWLTNAIYTIIRESQDHAINGMITHGEILKKLNLPDKGTLNGISYNMVECQYILNVMRNFKISYKVPQADIEFIPSLLTTEIPSDLEGGNYARAAMYYEMRYEYLPYAVLHSLMIQMYKYLDIEKCWYKGMVIDARRIVDSGLYAILDMNRDDDVLRIKIFAYADYAPWKLLQEIRTRLLEINSIMNLKAEDYIILDAATGEYVSIDRLLRLKERNIMFYMGDENDFDIDSLLSETFGEEQTKRLNKYCVEKENSDNSGKNSSQKKQLNLSFMKEALIQPFEERLFHPTEELISCEMVCEALLSACAQIQGNPLYWHQKEELRSMQVRTILRNRGFSVFDQTLYGYAQESRNPGEIDLMIMKNETDPLTIIEAMNLDSVSTSYISEHLIKLLDDYNPKGLEELFLVSYVQKAKRNFQNFWESYCDYINGMDAKDFKFVGMKELDTEGHYLKHALTEYDCGGAIYKVHHICMRAGD